jgi:hypothetical protein
MLVARGKSNATLNLRLLINQVRLVGEESKQGGARIRAVAHSPDGHAINAREDILIVHA